MDLDRRTAIQPFTKEEVRKALAAAREAGDRALEEYLKANTKWAKSLQGIKDRTDRDLTKLVVTT